MTSIIYTTPLSLFTNVTVWQFTFVIKILITFVNNLYMKMNDRLEQFLAAENITQAAFADKINVARASVSHILSGRNKPGYEFFASLVKNYPSLNIEWLISGKGKMYKFEDCTLFDSAPKDEPVSPAPAPPEQDNPSPQAGNNLGQQVSVETLPAGAALQNSPAMRHASRIIVFYDDGTFEEFGK